MKQFWRNNGVWIGLIVLGIALTLWTQGDFLSARNLTNLLRQTALNGILAAGMTVIILTSGIDLSIGSVVALCGVIVGISQVQWQQSTFTSFLMALLVGTFAGLINGGLIAGLRIAPFVITLGMMVIARGLAMIFSGGSSISPMGEGLNEIAGGYFSLPISGIILAAAFVTLLVSFFRNRAQWMNLLFPLLALILFSYSFLSYKGIPYLALFLFAVVLIFWLFLGRTVLGRMIYAIGSNEKAAYWAGVPITKVKVIAYTLMGSLCGLTAFLLSGRLNGADPNAGQLFELDAIAAVVIGGVSLKGGRGSVAGSLIGALMIATLNNGMDLVGISSFYQMVFKGLIIIIAVGLDRNQRE